MTSKYLNDLSPLRISRFKKLYLFNKNVFIYFKMYAFSLYTIIRVYMLKTCCLHVLKAKFLICYRL